jgi:hypothetical protein
MRIALAFSLWTVGVILFYSVITGPPFGFPKYFIAAMPTMAILGVVPVHSALTRFRPSPSSTVIGLLIVAALASSSAWLFDVSDESVYGWPGYAWMIALLMVTAAAVSAITGRWQARSALLALLLITVGYGLGMAAVQAADTRSVRYFPREVGFDATVQRLRALVGPNDPILAPKDIGSATYNYYHEEEQLFLDLEMLESVLDDESVSYAVVRDDWDYSYKIFPEAEKVIEEEMDLVEQIGDFLIYERENQ